MSMRGRPARPTPRTTATRAERRRKMPVHDLFAGNAVGFRIDPFYFAGNAGIKAGGVKEGDGPDARLPRKKIIPGFGDVAAERRQRRETGYNNAFAAHNSLMKQKVVERLMI